MPGYIAILGVFVADATFRTSRLPVIGETLLGQGFALGPGGKGSNQAVAAARAGGDVRFLTRLGRDTFGDMARDIWASAGVTPEVIDTDTPTGAACILVNSGSGDNAIVISPGAAGDIAERDIETWAKVIAGAAVFVTQLEQPVPAALRALQIARAGGAVTVLNPAPATDLPDAIYPLCDYVTPNETEAEALTGIAVTGPDTAHQAGLALIAKGAGAALITLGAQGAALVTPRGATHIPVLSAGPVVETTGAGDAFNGGFAVGLAQGLPAEEAARLGTATAALSVTRPGTAPSMPSRAEIDALLG